MHQTEFGEVVLCIAGFKLILICLIAQLPFLLFLHVFMFPF